MTIERVKPPGPQGPSDFFESEILVKSDFFGCMKDTWIFLGHEKKTEGFFWVLAKKGLRIFLSMQKKVVIFLGRQILKLWFSV